MSAPLRLSTADVLAELADVPANVEARGLLLQRPDAVAVGPHPAQGVVFAPQHGMGIGFGAPEASLAPALLEVARGAGMRDEPFELHLEEATADDWCALPGAADRLVHLLQVIPDGVALRDLKRRMRDLVTHEVATLESRDDDLLQTLPRALAAEFQAMEPWPCVVASLAGGGISSIASAFVETEGWFDVSIDTVPDFRRLGFGTSCAAELIRVEAARRLRPVWMVKESNGASVALAAGLGFETVGQKVGLRLAI